MRVLNNIKPQNVFSFFEDICAIPHGSGNTKAISDYLVSFAKGRNLLYYKDDINNVIIIKDASKGYESVEPIIIQSHIDMVCEKTSDCSKDMSKESIELIFDDEFISAKNTTLGADNGIGVAFTLALMDDDTLFHPRIEAVFTVDEEIGLIGASHLDVSPLNGKKMINLDSGDEKTFTVSCAGGVTFKGNLLLGREYYNGTALKITLKGLTGGHSGVKIGDGGANSNILAGRLLNMISQKCDFRISFIEGGLKDNAIPVETSFILITDDVLACKSIIHEAEGIFKKEYSFTDPSLNISLEESKFAVPFDKSSTAKIINLLTISPNGVQSMSQQIEGLVQTSLNFACISCKDDILDVTFSIRSSVETQKIMLLDKLKNIISYLGGTFEIYGDYPGWEYKEVSPFRDLICEVFKDKFSFEPNIEGIHAGLECGLFSQKIKDLDCISYGPDMWDIHTPKERLSVKSVQNVWELLCEFLKRLK